MRQKHNKDAEQENKNIKQKTHTKTRQLECSWKQKRFQVLWEDVHGGDMSYVRWKVVPSSRRCDGERAVAECRVSTWHSDGRRLCRPHTSSVDGDGSRDLTSLSVSAGCRRDQITLFVTCSVWRSTWLRHLSSTAVHSVTVT